MALDGLAILSASILSDWYYNRFVLEIVGDPSQALIIGAVVAALFIPFCRNGGLYNPTELLNLKSQVTSVSVVWFSVLFVLAGAVFALKAGTTISREFAASFVLNALVFIWALRLVWRLALSRGLAQGLITDRKIALIVLHHDNEGVLQNLTRHGIRVAKQFVLPSAYQPHSSRRGAADKIIANIRGSDAQEVMVVADLNRYEDVAEIIGKLKQLPLPVLFMPVGASSDMLSRPSRMIGLNPAFELQHSPQTEAQQATKRALDVSLALLGLLVLSPFLLLTALIIKLDSSGPALLSRSDDVDFNGREFVIYKFRTMTVQEDGEPHRPGRAQRSPCDPGRGISAQEQHDELPQLLNVWVAACRWSDRARTPSRTTTNITRCRELRSRNHVKPGLTGWAQVTVSEAHSNAT